MIYEGYGNFQRELAYAETERLLIAYPQVEAIVAMNSGLGAMSALEDDGKLDDVLVTRMGGQPDELRWWRGQDRRRRVPRPALHGQELGRGADHGSAGARPRDPRRVLCTDLRTLASVDTIREWVPKAMLDIDERLAQ